MFLYGLNTLPQLGEPKLLAEPTSRVYHPLALNKFKY